MGKGSQGQKEREWHQNIWGLLFHLTVKTKNATPKAFELAPVSNIYLYKKKPKPNTKPTIKRSNIYGRVLSEHQRRQTLSINSELLVKQSFDLCQCRYNTLPHEITMWVYNIHMSNLHTDRYTQTWNKQVKHMLMDMPWNWVLDNLLVGAGQGKKR